MSETKEPPVEIRYCAESLTQNQIKLLLDILSSEVVDMTKDAKNSEGYFSGTGYAHVAGAVVSINSGIAKVLARMYWEETGEVPVNYDDFRMKVENYHDIKSEYQEEGEE